MGGSEQPIWISRFSEAFSRSLVGALAGRTVAVEDNIDVAGLPTTAGASVVGKANMDQFATGLVGTRSPYGALSSVADPDTISGGSSSGSAVAVARGLVDLALGSETAGLGRIPAALNGIVGLKPTRGLISTVGAVPDCASTDCVSSFSRLVAEARLALGVMSDQDGRLGALDARGQLRLAGSPRVGTPPVEVIRDACDVEGAVRFEDAVQEMRTIGASVQAIDFTPFAAAAAALLYGGPWVADGTPR